MDVGNQTGHGLNESGLAMHRRRPTSVISHHGANGASWCLAGSGGAGNVRSTRNNAALRLTGRRSVDISPNGA
jgi:hypothetical protein